MIRPAMSPVEEAAYRKGLEDARAAVHRYFVICSQLGETIAADSAKECRQAINRLLGQT